MPPLTRAQAQAIAAEKALQLQERRDKNTKQRREVNKMRARGYKEQYQGCGYKKKLTKEQFKQAVLDGLIPYVVANSGCITTCVKPVQEQINVSECRNYTWKGKLFKNTGKKI